MTTFAPCATSRRASAAPWPRAPPLTSTTLLSKRAMSAPPDCQHGNLADRTAGFKIRPDGAHREQALESPTMRIAYLGPAGSWTHQAALDLFGETGLVPLARDELFAA